MDHEKGVSQWAHPHAVAKKDKGEKGEKVKDKGLGGESSYGHGGPPGYYGGGEYKEKSKDKYGYEEGYKEKSKDKYGYEEGYKEKSKDKYGYGEGYKEKSKDKYRDSHHHHHSSSSSEDEHHRKKDKYKEHGYYGAPTYQAPMYEPYGGNHGGYYEEEHKKKSSGNGKAIAAGVAGLAVGGIAGAVIMDEIESDHDEQHYSDNDGDDGFFD